MVRPSLLKTDAEIRAAREPRNDQKQNQLGSNGSAEINANINRRGGAARQETLMVFIEAGDQQGTEHSQDRSPPPKSPMLDGDAVQRLPPTVEEGQTDNSVTDEMTSLADEMMHFVPVLQS